ncbi:MAG: hypothetical protein LBH28_08440 [Oscillospiraceae bacterium]|nr:hypothetical protein [Oscillospiraceae bacterium]
MIKGIDSKFPKRVSSGDAYLPMEKYIKTASGEQYVSSAEYFNKSKNGTLIKPNKQR